MTKDCAPHFGDGRELASCDSSTEWVGCSKFSRLFLGLVAAPLLAVVVLAIVYREVFLAVIAVPGVLIVVGLSRVDLRIDSTGFSYRAVLGFPAKHIPLSEIHSMTATTISAWDWGGWGFRGLGKRLV